ncbi:MAG: calcium/sodium antiporter [Bacteroidales bacterium]|nr:calcium/sodium antiporter [Bacteroidales bacterium]
MVYLLFVTGFIILILGANILVDGASSLGRKLKMSSVVIGFTVVALGTSLPELIINIFASARGETDLAITNVLGSNIMNTLFIIGASAFIFHIIPGRRTLFTLVPISLFAGLVLALFANTNLVSDTSGYSIDFIEGIILMLFIVGYLYFSYRFSKSESGDVTDEIREFPVWRSIGMILIGVAGLYYGGTWVVDGAVVIADSFGMSKALVGITIIAVATSLPELVTSIIAALKKNSGIALGNALGSNIFNIFLVLGISAFIRPLPFDTGLNFDITVMVGSNLVVALLVFAGKGKMITRSEGALMMIAYIAYVVWLVFNH